VRGAFLKSFFESTPPGLLVSRVHSTRKVKVILIKPQRGDIILMTIGGLILLIVKPDQATIMLPMAKQDN
jgi:hypothetical protein